MAAHNDLINLHIRDLRNMIFEVSTVVNIQVEVYWVMTTCSAVLGHQRFGGTCCLHLQGEMNCGRGRFIR